MRALITGGAGFIGSHLSNALLVQGYRVSVIDNMSTGNLDNIKNLKSNSEFEMIEASIHDEKILNKAVRDADVIFHLAAAVGVNLIVDDPVKVIETNILGTHSILKAAYSYQKKILVASTSEIYGKGVKSPFAEYDDRLLGPTTTSRWSYAASKAVDEFLAFAYNRQLDLPVVIFRLFNTVGPRQTGKYGMVLPRFVERIMAGQSPQVYGDGQQTRCFCDVRDAVKAIILLSECESAIGDVYNIGSEKEISIYQLAKLVNKVLGGPIYEPELIPYEQAYNSGFEDMLKRQPDTSKIRSLIGWKPQITLEETISDIATQLGHNF
ncbi:MAG: NAD-dependent epimerase/dehydratase family protein [SAR202 cluster bacterium]|nr:NAD-dependent epimerase/dehydratase family protein [SAR202 cluster bacterium]|tara:strand:+ start:3836 stop:4804 length:969 start_codon:yes stop_codon:yes gene_type:complete